MPTDVLSAIKDLSSRFQMLGLVPGAIFALFVTALVKSGAPGDDPDLRGLATTVTDLSAAEWSLLVLAIAGVALVTQPLQLPLVRILEGYWEGPIVGWMRDQRVTAHVGRRAELAQGQRHLGKELTPERRREMVRNAWYLRRHYPASNRVMPTGLGNALRAAEDRAGRRYGLSTVSIWPRLYPLIPDKSVVDDCRNQLDVAVRFCALFGAAAFVSGALLIQHGWWLLVPVGALVAAWIAYGAAISAALVYGDAIEAMFDLYRFELIAALHLPLPATYADEIAANRKLMAFLNTDRVENFTYRHPDQTMPASSQAPLDAAKKGC